MHELDLILWICTNYGFNGGISEPLKKPWRVISMKWDDPWKREVSLRFKTFLYCPYLTNPIPTSTEQVLVKLKLLKPLSGIRRSGTGRRRTQNSSHPGLFAVFWVFFSSVAL